MSDPNLNATKAIRENNLTHPIKPLPCKPRDEEVFERQSINSLVKRVPCRLCSGSGDSGQTFYLLHTMQKGAVRKVFTTKLTWWARTYSELRPFMNSTIFPPCSDFRMGSARNYFRRHGSKPAARRALVRPQ